MSIHKTSNVSTVGIQVYRKTDTVEMVHNGCNVIIARKVSNWFIETLLGIKNPILNSSEVRNIDKI